MNYGLSGERIRLAQHHSSNDRMSNYSGNLDSPVRLERPVHIEKEQMYSQYDNNGHLIRSKN